MDQLKLNGIEVECIIGDQPEERENEQRLLVDVALDIDLDEAGQSDCLSYAAALDLSKLRLVVNDLAKLNQDCKYVIATNLTSCANEFASSNLPQGWCVKQKTSDGKVSLTLTFQKGTMFLFR